MKKHENSIGIFDSGLGGLTVLKKLQKNFPNETFIYIGDTAHLPYGNKSQSAIISYSERISEYLVSQNVKLIIVACNTASSLAFKSLTTKCNVPIIDVITPIKHSIIQAQNIHKIGVIGTHNTIQSNAYFRTLKSINKKLEIIQQACPLFVPIIEEGLQDDLIAHLAIKKYLTRLIHHNIDLLILGCTHYPLLKDSIKKNIPQNIQILDSANATSNYLRNYLMKNKLSCLQKTNKDRIIITDEAKNFETLAHRILNKTNIVLEILNITQ